MDVEGVARTAIAQKQLLGQEEADGQGGEQEKL